MHLLIEFLLESQASLNKRAVQLLAWLRIFILARSKEWPVSTQCKAIRDAPIESSTCCLQSNPHVQFLTLITTPRDYKFSALFAKGEFSVKRNSWVPEAINRRNRIISKRRIERLDDAKQ